MDVELPVHERLYEDAMAAQLGGDYTRLRELATELASVCESAGDRSGLARAYRLLGNVCLHNGDASGAERRYNQALEIHRLAGDELNVALVTMNLATVMLELHLDPAEAGRLYGESLNVFRRLGDAGLIAMTVANLGEVSRLGGDYAQALAYGDESLALFKQMNQSPRAAWQCINIAHYRLLRREYPEAVAMLAEADEHLEMQHNPVFVAAYIEMWFLLATELRMFEDGARLLGFADNYRNANGAPRLPGMMPWFSRETERLHRHIEPVRLAELLSAGETMSLEDAHELAHTIAAAVN